MLKKGDCIIFGGDLVHCGGHHNYLTFDERKLLYFTLHLVTQCNATGYLKYDINEGKRESFPLINDAYGKFIFEDGRWKLQCDDEDGNRIPSAIFVRNLENYNDKKSDDYDCDEDQDLEEEDEEEEDEDFDLRIYGINNNDNDGDKKKYVNMRRYSNNHNNIAGIEEDADYCVITGDNIKRIDDYNDIHGDDCIITDDNINKKDEDENDGDHDEQEDIDLIKFGNKEDDNDDTFCIIIGDNIDKKDDDCLIIENIDSCDWVQHKKQKTSPIT